MRQRMNFFQIFKLNPDNSIEPLKQVRIGGVQFGPGLRLGRGVLFGDVDLSQYIGRDLEVQEIDDVLNITGIY